MKWELSKLTLILILTLLISKLIINETNNQFNMLTTSSKISKKNPYSIHIDLDDYIMYVFKNGKVYKTYPVSGGTYKTPSPIGTWKIVSKSNWGDGFGGSWIGLNVPWGKYGIHGTDEPWSIGRPMSKGCIRMYNKDAKELKSYIPHGTKVTIVKGILGYFGDGFRTLKNGATGSDVYAVQLRLRALGYYPGYPDGKFGNGTQDAVVKFKKANKLGSTPVVTQDVYNAMGFFPFE